MAKKIPQKEADNEVVMVGVVINSYVPRPARPPTTPPEGPVCVIDQVWGHHTDGMVGPPVAPPAASSGVPATEENPNKSREEIKILVKIIKYHDQFSKCRDFITYSINFPKNGSVFYNNLHNKLK